MIVGYDVHHKKGKKSVFAFNATLDRNFCRYFSRNAEVGEMQEFVAYHIEDSIKDSLKAFEKANSVYPQ